MSNTNIRELRKKEINVDLFNNFDRYQEVNQCWRKIDGEWILKDVSFTDNWEKQEYKELVKHLINTVETGGTVWGVFKGDKLKGFASIENHFFGSKNEYLQLSSIHISNDVRGEGTGKKLFKEACEKARNIGAKKLYISAHSSKETMAFYSAMGCVEAIEYNYKLVNEEPYDCQLEYVL